MPESGYALTLGVAGALSAAQPEGGHGPWWEDNPARDSPPPPDTVDSHPLNEVRVGGVRVSRAGQGNVGASGARQRRPATHVF